MSNSISEPNPSETALPGTRIINLCMCHTGKSLTICTTTGFRTIRLDTNMTGEVLAERLTEPVFTGGVSVAIPLSLPGYFSIQSFRENGQLQQNRIYIWNNAQGKNVADINFSTGEVRRLIQRNEFMVIVLDRITHLYQLKDLSNRDSIDTYQNSDGIGDASFYTNESELNVIATLHTAKGHIKVKNYSENREVENKIHDSEVTFIAVSRSGRVGASANEAGTIIRVWSCVDLTILNELRRGSSTAVVSCIAFSLDNNWLAASSNKGTVHVWDITATEQPEAQSSLSMSGYFYSMLPKYFSSTRSTIKLSLPCEVNWAAPGSVVKGPVLTFFSGTEFYLASLDGSLNICRIDPEQAIVDLQSSISILPMPNTTIVEGNQVWNDV